MTSWLPIPADSDFSIHNLPFGIIETPNGHITAGVPVGDYVIDLVAAADNGLFGARRPYVRLFEQPTLNSFIALGNDLARRIRRRLQRWLTADTRPNNAEDILLERAQVRPLMPLHIGDYTDFYSSVEHATNVGKMFRPDNPLLPNWRWLPVGYHGRSSSIVTDGTPIRRPCGQILPKGADTPIFSASQQLDFELEMAFVIGKESRLGQPIPIEQTEAHIFGLMLFNDWSARDIQRWEYVPLGPFLGKNFASSISPWIVTLDALKPFRTRGPVQKPKPLDYLRIRGAHHYDINLEVSIRPQNGPETVVCRTNMRYLYWSMAQQLAHHTVNGCNVRPGDLMASGTISGPTPDSFGSLLELAWGGQKPITLADGSTRTFLLDGDTVIMRAYAQKGNIRVGFGQVSGTVHPEWKTQSER